MKIGFDVSQTGRGKAGCGYFADGLIRGLAAIDAQNDYVLYPTFGDAYWDLDWPTSTFQARQPNFRRGLGHRTHEGVQYFWGAPPADWEAQLGDPDLIHANNYYCPAGLQRARLVYTLYDLVFVEHPEWTTEANRVVCFGGVFQASLHADLIVAISEYSRRHFLETFPHYPADRIAVVHPASRFVARAGQPAPRQLAHLRPGQFWLNVGTFEPRKNHRRLLAAYAAVKARLGQTYPLALAGGAGWLLDDLEQSIADLGLQQDVLLLGYVDDEALQWLYENCFALVYPALFEGFGLPVLEAMTLGAPVVTSNVTSLPEITGDAALLVDPFDECALGAVMERLQTEPELRARLQAEGAARAQQFGWERAARAVLDLYSVALTLPRREAPPAPALSAG
jgi:glycosyltransferase involved in cell wall biosynthesis